MEEQINNQIEKMQMYVTELEEQIRKKHTKEENLETYHNEKKRYEMRAREKIYEETDDNGKKKYTNEQMRSIATQKLLDLNTEYQSVNEKTKSLEKEISSIKVEIELLSTKLGVLKKQSDLICSLAKYKGEINGTN